MRQKDRKARRVFATTVKSGCKWHFRATPGSSFLPGKLELYLVPLLRGRCCQRLKNKDITKLKTLRARNDFSHKKAAKAFQCQEIWKKRQRKETLKRPSSFPLEVTAWTRGPQIVTYSQQSLELIFPNPRC